MYPIFIVCFKQENRQQTFMALHELNMSEWKILENKIENTPIPNTNRSLEVRLIF